MFTQKLVVSFLLLVVSLFVAPFSVFAVSSLPNSSASATTTLPLPPTVSPTSPMYTDLLVHNLFHSFSCLAVGQSVIGQPCLTYQLTKNAQGAIQGIPVLSQVNTSGGIFGTTTNLIGALYANPPIRTTDYLASMGEGLGVVKTAKAQAVGTGALVLNPILTLWQASRNISYVLLIVIFLIIGLMVMFRNKINPQTVISAQAALPGLIIGLILITFSYFLAGLITDTAFIGTNIVGYYFVAAQDKLGDPAFKPQQNMVQELSAENSLSVFSKFVGIITNADAQDALAAIFNNLKPEVQSQVRWLAGIMAFQFTSQPGQAIPVIGQFVGPIIGLIGSAATANDPTAILGFVLAFVASFALIYAMIKLLLRLINSYLTIIFLTLSAPFQFLFAALPGRQGIATGWILNMLSNVLAFPAVLAVFYFVAFILGESFGPLKIAQLNHIQNTSLIHAVYAAGEGTIVDSTTFPLFGGMNLNFVRILLAFGALMATPAIPEIIARTVGKASQAGQLIGQEIGSGIRGGQGYAQRAPGQLQGGLDNLSTGIGGKRELMWNPGTSTFERVVTQPGWMQIDTKGSKNPFKWGLRR